MVGQHSSAVVCTIVSQQEVSGLKSDVWLGSFCVMFARSHCHSLFTITEWICIGDGFGFIVSNQDGIMVAIWFEILHPRLS